MAKYLLKRLPLLVAVLLFAVLANNAPMAAQQEYYRYADSDSLQDDSGTSVGSWAEKGPRVAYFSAADHPSGGADWAMMIRASDIIDSCGVTLGANEEPIITRIDLWFSGTTMAAELCTLKIWHHDGDTLHQVVQFPNQNQNMPPIWVYADSVMFNLGDTTDDQVGFWWAGVKIWPYDFLR